MFKVINVWPVAESVIETGSIVKFSSGTNWGICFMNQEVYTTLHLHLFGK